MICTKCHIICDDVCPKCGKSKFLKSIEDDEPVLLCVLTHVQMMFVEPVLKDEHIPYSCIGSLGGGITAYLGEMLETYSIYVPYSIYESAYEKLVELFGEESDIVAALREFR